jgi:anti-anti-sigma factor
VADWETPTPECGPLEDRAFRGYVDDAGRVVVTGEIDLASLEGFRVVLEQAMHERAKPVVLDASGLTFMDSAAITELLTFKIRVLAAGGELRIEGISPEIADVFGMLDLSEVLPLAPALG